VKRSLPESQAIRAVYSLAIPVRALVEMQARASILALVKVGAWRALARL
jgi:hypothetical protein